MAREMWVSAITGKMNRDDPDSILEAILLTQLNGVLCDYDNSACADCRAIWDAIDYRLQRGTT